jgi:hypothetical protein
MLPGDIVLHYRPKYDERWFMFWKYLLQRGICFFTTEWWMSEHSSNVTHTEMVYAQIDEKTFKVIDEEPPSVQFKTRSLGRHIIFSLINKPPGFYDRFYAYVHENLGKRYEYWKFVLFILDWVFHTDRFTKQWDLHHYYVCSEFVAKFYEQIGSPCSAVDFESTSPDSIFDYCMEHPEIFKLISDIW